MSMHQYLGASHVQVTMSPTDTRFVEGVLIKMKRKRNIVINVPSWLLLPPILTATDLIAAVPDRLAQRLAEAGIVARELPFASKSFAFSMYWHKRHGSDASIAWLRSQVVQSAKTLS